VPKAACRCGHRGCFGDYFGERMVAYRAAN